MGRQSLHLHPVVADTGMHRLRMFAGRYLSEREFDLMQSYVDARCDQLLLRGIPGIVHGLSVDIEGAGDAMSVRVEPGLAVGGDGRAIHLFYPVVLDWAAVIDEYKRRVTPPGAEPEALGGYYFLTVRRRVALVDEAADEDPCSRTDPDPLRDSRLETYATLDLQFVSDDAALLAAERPEAANRILVQSLRTPAFNTDTGAIPVALCRIAADESLTWIDAIAGRFLAVPDAAYRALQAHWEARVASGDAGFSPDLPLSKSFGVAYLPAAGSLPDGLVTDIAGHEDPGDAQRWLLPAMQFEPNGLQIELLPVPDNAVEGIKQYELARGVIDLVEPQQDRVRIMVAVSAPDYRPDLMDLPEIDFDLIDELYRRQHAALSAFNTWAGQFDRIYHNLAEDVDAADPETLSDAFDGVYKTMGPEDDFEQLKDPEVRSKIGLSPVQKAPQKVLEFLGSLRPPADLQPNPNQLPRPYSQFDPEGWPPAPEEQGDVEPRPGDPGDGLYRRRYELRHQIETLRASLEESASLISNVSDYVVLQRQQLDSISVSFAALAGGVAGDGSGLNLMRWVGDIDMGQPPSDDGNS